MVSAILDRTRGGAGPSRRMLYRRSKRMLLRLLAARWRGPRRALEPAVRRFLGPLSRRQLSLVVGDLGVATAAVLALLASRSTVAAPPIELSDIAAGVGGFVINGIDTEDRSGRSVSSAGDVNGDGLADLIVGAHRADPGGDGDAGESYVVFGKTGTAGVDLAVVAAGVGGFVINGIDAMDESGWSVSGAGDVNGDGLADVIVGAPQAAAGGDAFAGESYVVFGKAGTGAVSLASVTTGTGGFVIKGINVEDQSGHSVAGAGDVNGDGLADVIIGAPYADSTQPIQGETYVVFGKAGTAAVDLAVVAAGVGGFVINGIDFGDRSGWSVSGGGDVNGDGLSDVIIGAPFATGGHAGAGVSYVVFGKSGTGAVDLANVTAGTGGGFVIHGIDPVDHSGWSVSGAGDVNGDDLDDLIVGAPEVNSSVGESYVVFGKADMAAVELDDVVAGVGGFVMSGIDHGIDAPDSSGRSVSGAGDVNGDGLADLIVGAFGADPGGDSRAGESYVVFGKAGTGAVNLADVAAGFGGFVINGVDADDRSGFSVSGAGDVNNDGLADLIVGAYFADPGGDSAAGESYVVFAPTPCPADIGGSGGVGFADLVQVLLNWGSCPPSCPWDIDSSGDVGFADLTQILVNWGPCAP